jgi:hypothetical protein
MMEEICRHMNVEIGAEAALFPEKEYIGGIFDAVLFAVAFSVFVAEFANISSNPLKEMLQ